jgi:hypothetical protein
MDDQRTDRAGSGGVSRSPKRFRISLKAMLLVVTLFCVLCACAYYRVHRNNVLRAESAELSRRAAKLEKEIRWPDGPRDPEWSYQLRCMTDRIAEINKELGENHDGKKLNPTH